MTREEYFKTNYIEARDEAIKNNEIKNVGSYTFTMLQKLRDMAKENIYPDGRFGDEECNVWSLFRSMT